MKVIVTVTGIAHESAGPSYTVPALCKCLQRAGADVELHTLGKLPQREWPYPVCAYPRVASGPLRMLGWSPAMMKGLRAAAAISDVVHVNGIWQLPDVYPMRACRGQKCKVVYCPRGGLSPVAMWRGRVLLKKLMWYIGGQRRALEEVSMFHAASQKEHDEIRALGYKQPIAIVPNGVDVPEITHKPFVETDRTIAFFGRIHLTKAVNHLVEAWGRVAADFPAWSLKIAGPDCGAVAVLREMVETRRIPRVGFVGELKGIAKYEFLAKADLYVLPSLTENFGITIAEALSCGTPVIASRGCPWKELVTKQCGWWIDVGADALERQLRETLAMEPDELEKLGRNGRLWMKRDLTWESTAQKMLAAYEWLVNGGTRPEWIHVGT